MFTRMIVSKEPVQIIRRECTGFQYFNGKVVPKPNYSLALIGGKLQVVNLKNTEEIS